ncbi:MAG: D-lysine 5,6-aminomutase subunit alpha [Deltaproteobacteria bacterium]|nr:D-lysine 5,6-aminomutase subunit alpha [Deltaproteobacteria bacterium]MBT7887996.1 D-lysine 5,6-aminomutase subunit alpha [Deltaproteobacteria bacterium]
MANLKLDQSQIAKVKKLAADIADEIQAQICTCSSVSVERAVLRLFGVDGASEDNTPLPNKIVELARKQEMLDRGISAYFAQAMLKSGRDPQTTAELLERGNLSIDKQTSFPAAEIAEKEAGLARHAFKTLQKTRENKLRKQVSQALPAQPWRYIIVATGNIYEDRTQARSAVYSGADIIAVIRSTAQSLLDYVPFGPTTEGFGGTYATQANFKIIREALDEAGEEQGRYIRLVNYSSGLCMAEIAACAALEDLDMLLNDSMYGILFRDINMKRTFVDQYFSRLICTHAGIIINTGEDNYLTTSDAIEAAHTVTASQLINEAMAKKAQLPDDLLGLGHAFEINPQIENAFLYELAHAQLARQLFPNAPLKYMPPTKYKSTDIFHAHCLDTMFNLASVTTGQGIHLAGILTEASHTPLMQDRFQSLRNIDTIFNVARNLGDEIEFKADGFINRRAQTVLTETEAFLNEIKGSGLMKAISGGKFADISRAAEGGKGYDGVFTKARDYSNPVMDLLEKPLNP